MNTYIKVYIILSVQNIRKKWMTLNKIKTHLAISDIFINVAFYNCCNARYICNIYTVYISSEKFKNYLANLYIFHYLKQLLNWIEGLDRSTALVENILFIYTQYDQFRQSWYTSWYNACTVYTGIYKLPCLTSNF